MLCGPQCGADYSGGWTGSGYSDAGRVGNEVEFRHSVTPGGDRTLAPTALRTTVSLSLEFQVIYQAVGSFYFRARVLVHVELLLRPAKKLG